MLLEAPAFPQSPKPQNNSIGLISSLHEFFDGAPNVFDRQIQLQSWRNLAWGLQYSRSLKSHTRIRFSTKLLTMAYHRDNSYPVNEGDILNRWGIYFEAAYERSLVSFGKWNGTLLMGLGYRVGHETKLLYYWQQEQIAEIYGLSDIGIFAGIGFRRTLNRFELGLESYFNRYVLFSPNSNYTPLSEYPYRPSRNMLTIQLGINYRF